MHAARRFRRPVVPLFLAAALLACSAQQPAEQGARRLPAPQARLVNGDFETGDLTGWTVDTGLNPGLASVPPPTFADLGIQPGGNELTSIVTGAAESQVPSGLSADVTLRVPRYGTHAVVVNEQGYDQNLNVLHQASATSTADVDPYDGKVHVRFALAPVLESGGHEPEGQPYFWVQLVNVTRSTVLFHTYNFADQPGVPWKTDPQNGDLYYTDWQAFDISPGPDALDVGDQVELQVVASGCAYGGHFGEVYVDGIGPVLPGLSVAAHAPEQVNEGDTLAYTITYRNDGQGTASNVVLTDNLPEGTTFASVSAGSASCTTPAVGGTGAVSCNVGAVNPGGSGSITLTVTVTATAGSTVSNGDYNIAADGVSALIGPLVTTEVTSEVVYADLSITASDGASAVGWGQPVTYAVVVHNAGPSAVTGASVAAAVPASLASMSWTCTPGASAACGAPSGTGALAATVDLAAGASATFTLSGTIAAGSGSGTLRLRVQVDPPAGVSDPAAGDDVAVDLDAIGTLRTLTVQKAVASTGTGRVVSVPAGISCAGGCSSQSASFADGASVTLSAAADPGYGFAGWGGACSGTATTCTLTMDAARTVSAEFGPVTWTVTGSVPGGYGTVDCTSPVADGTSSTCTITTQGSDLVSLVDNGVDVTSSVSGSTYVIAAVTGSHAVVATFSPHLATVAVTQDPDPVTVFSPVTLTGTVTAVSPEGTPTGTLTFAIPHGATPCQDVPLVNGVATCTFTPTAAGLTMKVTYSGDATWAVASWSGYLDVDAILAPIVAQAVPNPVPSGATTTVSGAVLPPLSGASTPAGWLYVYDGWWNFINGQALAADGTFDVPVPGLADGSYSLYLYYSPSSGAPYQETYVALPVVVGSGMAVTLTSSADPSAPGQTVTFTAQLAASAGSPTGAVTFIDTLTDTPLCSDVPLVDLVATCDAALAEGTYDVVASYSGDGEFDPASSGTWTQLVYPLTLSTTLDLVASPNPAAYGQAVTVTATVAASSGAPTGTVAFTDGGNAIAGCEAVALAGGVATCTLATPSVGDHPLAATYTPADSHFSGSTGSADLTVGANAVTVAVTSSRNPSRAGRPVTLTANLASAGAVPTGTVTFLDGEAELGQAALVAGQASLTTRALAKGTHAITASYPGTTGFQAGSGSLSEVVDNSPPVAGSGTALSFGPAAAASAQVAVTGGVLDLATGTIELWARTGWSSASEVGTTPTLLCLGPCSAPRVSLGFTPDRASLVVTVGATASPIATTAGDGAWHHLALVSSGSSLSLRLDGAEIGTVPGGPGTAAVDSVTLGEGYVGAIDEVRIWSTARSQAELAAARRSPLHGSEDGLLALWRLDEGEGAELLDASPSHLDGSVAAAEGAGESPALFAASTAWSARTVDQGGSLDPVDAGYDADGDPLALALSTPPAYGTASADAEALQVLYQAPADYLGEDPLTFTLDDGVATSDFTLDVIVVAAGTMTCKVDSDCAGDDVCMRDVCTAPSSVEFRSGGCSAAGGGGGLLLALLGLGLAAARRKVSRIAGAALLLAWAGAARAAEPQGFALQTYEPAPAGDRFFSTPDVRVHAGVLPSLAIAVSPAVEPLVAYQDGHAVPGGKIVRQQTWGFLQASLPVLGLVQVDAALPVALSQSGDKPFSGLDRVQSSAVGDLKLGARAPLLDLGAAAVGIGLQAWLPTGSKKAFASDGAARVLPQVLAGGGIAQVEWSAAAGYLLRRDKDVYLTRTAGAVAYSGAVALRLGELRVGPELFGRRQVAETADSPVEALLGARWLHGPWQAGLAGGMGLNHAPGAAKLRGVLSLGWSPGSGG
jgi:uncharacterized repeat protein (TIGR01451 family)